MLTYHERAEERLQEMAGALPAKKGRPEREAGERVAAHAMTTKPPDAERVAVWKREMSEAENAEFEEAAGHLLDELGYETATPRESWIPPEEWARLEGAHRPRPRQGQHALTGVRSRELTGNLPVRPGPSPHPHRSPRQLVMGLFSKLRRSDSARREPAVFVVGMNRSGTTLLRMMLDAHPQLTIPPETHFVPDLIKAAKADDATPEERARGDEVGPRVGRLRLLRRGDARAPAGARRGSRPARRCAPSTRPTWSSRASRAGARRRPTYVQKMKLIQRALPEARFVHVIRDGRDVALSVLDRTVRDLTAGDVANRWQQEDHQGARATRRKLDHYMEIRYEDLILDTEPVLRRVVEFVELPWDDAMLSYHERSGERLKEMARALPGDGRAQELSVERRMATHAMTTKPPSADRVARWRTQMSAEQRERVRGDRRRPARGARLSDRTRRGREGHREDRSRGTRPERARCA